uniref:Uncharacterized protein n=1 Tax=Tanacetum cinerariifolium TaxID=118510 RepID=A0A699GKA5_TANCI|nr:hypothetical protein [Tanacetum cinerariifolium]
MKDYENDKATSIPTLIFSVKNWTLKKDQPEVPPFTPHMMAICTTDGPEEFRAPKTTLLTEELGPKGKKPRAKTGDKKSIPMMMKNPMSKLEATFIGTLLKEGRKTQKDSMPQQQGADKGTKINITEKLEIEVPRDLSEVPDKLQEFQSSILALITKVASLEDLKLEIPTDLVALPRQVSSINT